MIEGAQAVVMNFLLGFFFGLVPILFLMRGLIMPFLSVRFGSDKYLLRVHLDDGFSTRWRVGVREGQNITFKDKKEKRIVTLAEGVVKRSMGVNWVDVSINETVPFSFSRITYITQEVETTNEAGEKVKDYKKVLAKFFGWDDSPAIMVALKTALMQPRSGFSLNFDMKKVLIIIGVLVLATVYVLNSQKGGGSII